MTKRELIDAIVDINPTAMPEFLARFSDLALHEYYEHLCAARQPRPAGHGERYEQYFGDPAATPSPQSQSIAVAQVADDLDETDEELTRLLAERAHRALNHLLDDVDPAAALVYAEDFDDPAPVTQRAANPGDPYPLELDDLSDDDPMADIGLSPHRTVDAQPEPIGAAAGCEQTKQTISRLSELKQERSLF
ncbi:MAG: hypothetical protein GVY16_03005 [Planctomycetes bacterium]|jgi:hypothetical protein|nr:hypothetical protein [Phycisphaerae bacterium]NBB94688.1 hypothetical protein [Planctomycetota bacterium]